MCEPPPRKLFKLTKNKTMTFKPQLSKLQQDLSIESPAALRNRALQCLQVASIACYAFTMAKKATDKAIEARIRANASSVLARKLTEAVDLLKKNLQLAATPLCNDNQALVRLYVSAERKPISFYKFITMIKPSEELIYYDNEDDNSEAAKCEMQTSTSSDSCNIFNLPHIRKVRSISESEFAGNILSISDQRRKLKRIKSPRPTSPLLCKEDAENVQTAASPNPSQQSSSQVHRFSLRFSRSCKSLPSEKIDDAL